MADEQKPALKIYVMPERFLVLTRAAGLPVQKAPLPPVTAPPPTPKPAPAPAPTPSSPPPASASSEISNLKSQIPLGPGIPMEGGKRKMMIVWGVLGGVILIGGGLSAFFALRSVKAPAPPTPAPIPAPTTTRTNTAPSPPINVPPLPPEPEPEPEPEPPPVADKDTDADGLTDAEEIVLGTDAGLTDSDRDGYGDATELANLYNPAGVAPQRILDAGIVYEYEHPTQGWSIYVPRAWSVAATDQTQREVIITTQAVGEKISVQVRDGEAGLGPHDAELGVQPVETKRGAMGMRNVGTGGVGGVMAEAWFSISDTMTLTLTHRVATPPTRYPHLFDMIVQSFAGPSRGGPLE